MSDTDANDPGPVRKAVIPAAGLGTRFLPATKTIPKEMFPIIDKPVLQFVVEEAIESRIEELLIITRPGKAVIERHFAPDRALDAALLDRGDEDGLARLHDLEKHGRITFIDQPEPRGLGDAVRLSREFANGEPVAVMLGDAVIGPAPGAAPGLRQLLDAYAMATTSVVAVESVPRTRIQNYGVIEVDPESSRDPDLLRIRRLVEKPTLEEAPSDLAIAGRYVLTNEIFDHLDEIEPGVGGEIQLTDAMNRLAAAGRLHALRWRARRFDIGGRLDYVQCFIEHALRRDDIGDSVRESLRRLLGDEETS